MLLSRLNAVKLFELDKRCDDADQTCAANFRNAEEDEEDEDEVQVSREIPSGSLETG